MSHGVFITGTDTGVGKTVASAALLLQYKARNRRVMYMKPVQTGCIRSDDVPIAPDPAFCFRIAGLTPRPDEQGDVCPYRFLMAASPHLAAARERATISLDQILQSYQRLQERYETLVVEGAGGVWVPLNENATMLDLMQRLALPVIVVCRAGLGTLNHSLLTLQALRTAHLKVAGLILVQTTPDPWGDIETDNEKTLQRMGQLPVLGRITYHPALADGTADARVFSACVRENLIPADDSL